MPDTIPLIGIGKWLKRFGERARKGQVRFVFYEVAQDAYHGKFMPLFQYNIFHTNTVSIADPQIVQEIFTSKNMKWGKTKLVHENFSQM